MDEARFRHELRRYWDEIARGRPAALGEVDPKLATMIRQLHELPDVPPPDPTYARQLRESIMHISSAPVLLTTTRLANGRTSPRSHPSIIPNLPDSRRRRWILAYLSTAALIIITMAVTFLAIGPPWPTRPVEDRGNVPAVVAPATPSPSMSVDDSLVTVTLPAGAVPAEIVAGLNHYSVPAGNEGKWSWTCCTGPRLDYILEGTITVRGAGPMRVQRDGDPGSWEDIAPGTDIILEPGDALLSRLEDSFDAVNAGSLAVELLDLVLVAGTPLDDPVPYQESGAVAWEFQDQDLWLLPITVPEASVTIDLWQASLETDAIVPPPQGAMIQLAITRDEGAIISTQEGFVVKNLSQAPVSAYLMTLTAEK